MLVIFCCISLSIVFAILSCENPLMTVLRAPEISVLYNGQEIASGTELVLEQVEFGAAEEYTFTILNKGKTGTLNLDPDSPVSMTSDYITMFTLQNTETAVIEPSSSTSFTVTFSPFGFEGEKTAVVTIINDDEGESTYTFTLSVNATASVNAPSVTISSVRGSPVNTVFPVNITFSAPVTGFIVDDMEVVNGTADNLQTDDNMIYTADITPSSDPIIVSLRIPAGVALNAGGKGNKESNTIEVDYDTDYPSVEISSPGANPGVEDVYYTATEPIPITITFTHVMDGFSSSDIDAAGGIVADFNDSGNPVFTCTVSTTEGTRVTVDIPAYTAQSISTDQWNLEAITYNIEFDGTAPAGLTLGNTGFGYSNFETVELELSASDSVSGLSEMWISNDNFASGDWETWSETGTWTINPGIGTLTAVSVKVRDTAGNESGAASHNITLTEDAIVDYSVIGTVKCQ